MPKHFDTYHIPTAITKPLVSVIQNQFNDLKLTEGTVENSSIEDYRKCKVQWIATDHWVSGMLSHFVECANLNSFQYDLDAWASRIQYTVYDNPGCKYDWHIDNCVSDFHPEKVRKLSISLCLSSKDEYEGGEFQILMGRSMKSFKMDCGDAIIFPSDCTHRVRPLKSGKRISLVGWMGGPKFK